MGTPFIGRLVDVGFAKEASRGAKTAPTYWSPKTELSFDSKTETVKSGQSYGRIDQGVDQFVAQKYAQGDFKTELNDTNFGLILLALLGATSPTNNGDSTYTHAYTIDQDSNQHQSLSIAIRDEIGSLLFNGCMIDSLTLEIRPNDIVRYSVGFMGRGVHDWTTLTPTYTDQNHFLHQHLTFKLAANVAGLAAASPISLKSLTLNVSKNLIKEGVMGTLAPEDIYNQMLEITGSLELNYTDRTYRNYMLDNTYKTMQIKLQNTDVIIGGGTANPTLDIQLPRVGFEAWESNRPNDELVTQKIDFTAYYDLANSLAPISTCELRNTTSSY